MAAGYAIVLHRLLIPLHQLLLDLLRGMPALLSGRLQQPTRQGLSRPGDASSVQLKRPGDGVGNEERIASMSHWTGVGKIGGKGWGGRGRWWLRTPAYQDELVWADFWIYSPGVTDIEYALEAIFIFGDKQWKNYLFM